MTYILNLDEIKSLKRLFIKILEKLHSHEDLKEARVMARLLKEIDPKDPEAWYFLGCFNGALGDFNEAKNNLLRSLELGGEKFPNYSQLANICMNHGELKEAINWGYRALESNPECADIYHKIANLHILDGDLRKAVKLLESLLAIPSLTDKERFFTLLWLGHLCVLEQRMKKALAYFKEAQELNTSDDSLWRYIGHCLDRLGDKEGALKAFEKAAASEPSPLNLYNLGDAYLSMDDPEKSIAPLIEATRKDPAFLLAYYDLSLAFFRMKRYEEGVAAAISAIRPDPEMKSQKTNLGIGAMNNMGICLMNMGRYEEALECYRRIMKLLAPAYFNMGLTFFKMKHFKEALKYFQLALDINPDDPEYLDLIGQTYTELGKYKLAEEYLRQSLKKDPQYALGYYDLGTLLAKFKTKQSEAHHCFMKAIKLDPKMKWAYYSIACLYARSCNKEKALDFLKQSLEKGLSDKKHIDKDRNLDSLREENEFKSLMAKYFPEEA